MRKKIFILSSLLLLLSWNVVISQNNKIPKSFKVSEKSIELFKLINDVRESNNLKPISLSASLCYVAATHISDLIKHHPDTSLCNLHSWSDKGAWTSCCYQAYIPIQECMWNKPKELTPYKYRGYELAFWQNRSLTAEEILVGWMDIPEASNMILNMGKWTNEWRAMGVGIEGTYAVVWFGRAVDREPSPKVSDKISAPSNKESSIIKEKTNLYFLIFGSYKRLKDVEKRLARLQKDGFKNAVILISEGKYRLALSSHKTLELAKANKSQLNKKYDEAWILKY